MGSPFIAAVERWRKVARPVGDRPEYEIPQGWILAVIENESAGVTGIDGPTGEAGLMQTQPGLVALYNKDTGNRYRWEDMRAKDDDSGIKQIFIGTHYLARCRNDVAAMVPPAAGLTPAQVYYADLAYGSGLGALRSHRKATKAAGLPDTFDGMETLAKRGEGTIPARKFGHARRVVSLLKKDGLAQGYNPESFPRVPRYGIAPRPRPGPDPGPGPSPDPSGGGGGAAAGFAIIAIVGLFAFGLLAKERKARKRAGEADPVYYGYYSTP